MSTIIIQIPDSHCSWVGIMIGGLNNWGSPYYIKGIIGSIVFKNYYSVASIISSNNFLFSITVHIHATDNGSGIIGIFIKRCINIDSVAHCNNFPVWS